MGLQKISLIRFLLPLCFIFISGPMLHAAPTSGAPTQEQVQSEPVTAKLIAEDQTIQPGHPFWVGVQLNMNEGWDTYWSYPGDAGFPTKVDWKLPSGFTAGPIQWPFPERFETQSVVAYGYTHSVLLMTEITPPKDLPAGTKIDLSADVSWVACNDSCIPGNAHLDLNMPVASQAPEKDAASAPLFAGTRQLLPQTPLKDDGAFSVSTQAEDLVLHYKASQPKEYSEVLFIPQEAELIDHAAPQSLLQKNDGFQLSMKKAAGSETPNHLKGVLIVSEKGSDVKKAIQVDTDLKAPVAQVASEVSSFSVALILAFFGGLILNVMPCVLPVIALKIFSFVKMAQEKRSLILKHGLVFGGGVVLSFWVLSGALLILRAYGQGLGWGFQLQEPVFVAVLTVALFLLGLSLFGVFEMGTSLISLGQKAGSSKSPLLGSFLSGVLATAVATPCTGPLLGPALGFAMTLTPLLSLSIFTSMGIGMAAPYLLFSAFPKLIRFLPKPGNWMIVFKQIMGFLMMGTVVWLIWVFGAQTDQLALLILLASLLVLSIGAWIFGSWAVPSKPKMTRLIATVLSAAILLVGGSSAVMSAKGSSEAKPQIANAATEGAWQAYSPDAVAKLRSEGKPVFVDFTAKWCLICQANKVVLHSSDVANAFAAKGVVTMTADWTKRDAQITEELKKLGRTGVPVYALYPAGLDQPPIILPQTLTGSVVTDYLNKIGPDLETVQAD